MQKKKEVIRKSFTEDPEIENAEYIGAFLKETGELIGYGIYEVHEDWVPSVRDQDRSGLSEM